MKKTSLVFLGALLIFCGCSREYKVKPKLEITEALGQRIQQAMIDYAAKNPEYSELIGRTIAGLPVRIEEQVVSGSPSAGQYMAAGVPGKQLSIGGWILNREKMLIATGEAFENGTQIIYQAPFTVSGNEVKITEIRKSVSK